MKRAGPGFHANQRHYYPTRCVIKLWTSPPQDATQAKNTHGFERRLDKFSEGRLCGGYYVGRHAHCSQLRKSLRHQFLENGRVSEGQSSCLYLPAACHHHWLRESHLSCPRSIHRCLVQRMASRRAVGVWGSPAPYPSQSCALQHHRTLRAASPKPVL